MVPTPVSVWRVTPATDAPAGPGEPHSPGLTCTSTTSSPKEPSPEDLHLELLATTYKAQIKRDTRQKVITEEVFRLNNGR